MRKVIMISGFKRAGKDTVTKFIEAQLIERGYSVEIMSMATPLKQFVCTQLNISMEELEKLKNDEEQIWIDNIDYDVEPISNFRKLLQKTGDAIKELSGSDSVLGYMLGCNASESDVDFIIVSDFRYLVELGGLEMTDSEEFEIITIRIDGNRVEAPSHDHASEWDLLDNNFAFDYYIQNSKEDTLLSLERTCANFVDLHLVEV